LVFLYLNNKNKTAKRRLPELAPWTFKILKFVLFANFLNQKGSRVSKDLFFFKKKLIVLQFTIFSGIFLSDLQKLINTPLINQSQRMVFFICKVIKFLPQIFDREKPSGLIWKFFLEKQISLELRKLFSLVFLGLMLDDKSA